MVRMRSSSVRCGMGLRQQPNLLSIAKQGAAERDDTLPGGDARSHFDRVAVGVPDLNVLGLGVSLSIAIAKSENGEAFRMGGRMHNCTERHDEARRGFFHGAQDQRSDHAGTY